ncbi:hypothetical protein [Frigoriflavimonas asaccharolytica]|uniref:Beta-glucosidase/6-phospho-beta-glucosidase/beta-galactosidase n=1 Tax=Frigoriflavimonas asaccharolytica TaxID=2735899 RepID=A0A8J8GBI2_9FLAO|nr:hypothetical protein [Frigoriflavimonas asaccharolytica]NRS92920.1 beta-glucosidase/6-phospho-beta-glucosidase/beta-galactosidase [Frigoriflavimonas asaccharolytica]
MHNPFSSYFIGGFECADHLNRSGERVNLLKNTEHDIRAEEDYKLLLDIGITTVREGICWSEVETGKNIFDFSEVLNRIQIAENLGIQIIWDMIHFGYPEDLFPTHPKFCERFINLCSAFVKFYLENSSQPFLIVPINEISFLSWFSGDVRGTAPYLERCGFDMKYHLCKAAILGIKTIKKLDPTATVFLVEPAIQVHNNGLLSEEELLKINGYQFEAVDMISGRMCPELGGNEELLDIFGLNYYWNCQWIEGGETVYWPDPLKKRKPLNEIISEIYTRYGKPIFLSETGHFGVGRVQWIEEIHQECLIANNNGVPFWGICIYPVTDRPDWDNLESYSNCGIFDLDSQNNRIPEKSYVECIKKLVDETSVHQ